MPYEANGEDTIEKNSSSYDPKLLEELIIKTANGDEIAFEDLYNKTYKIVFGYIISLNKDYFTAQDILQDTFIKVRLNASKYTKSKSILSFSQKTKEEKLSEDELFHGNPLGWILKIAKNQTLMCFRKSKREVLSPDEEEEKIINIASYTDFDSRVLLEGALKLLNRKQKTILILHAVSGFKHKEIANILNLPLGTVLSNYSEAIKKLKAEILGKEESR